MKKHTLLLAAVGFLIFIGGFFSRVYFSNIHEERSKTAKFAPKLERAPLPKQKPKIEQAQQNVLIGYVQDFRDPDSVDYSKLTHVIFSFAHPTKDGRLLFHGETAMTNLRGMIEKAHQQNKKAILAVGGWYHIQGGESYEYFKAAISNPTSRTTLINELVDITEREGLDGIDIDFEHPRSKEDAENLAAFTKTLSEKLHAKDKELSAAVYAKVHSVTGTEITAVVYEPNMFQHLDYVNIMAYDGQWDGEYNAANLSPYSFSENVVNYWSNLFETHGLSKEKLVLGVPFYAQPEDVSIKQVSYAAIVNSSPENAERDTVNMNGTTYHYNGMTTIQKKTKLALEHGFGGMMLWEAGHDSLGPHSLTGAILEVLEEEGNNQKQYTRR
ncbi:glycoside hydrolase family 18 protein [Bacillus taeanensis]|uniref:chitinase n=1 Tax=Bacillus taeanensis TaxID=273032 RepID=A0A366XZU5_9BACI|nr:glycoside hydrolase family 18 protein [Bacillus taeanensis]RBW69673.1 chitinase [Bacillus taeanensis]